MGTPTTLDVYREQLAGLLDDAQATLSTRQLESLRTTVHERRNRRRAQEQTRVAAELAPHVAVIVTLLDDASSRLRPREAQELDDLVAGRTPAAPPPPRRSVKLHSRGTMRSI
jgi:hypothetical protein